MIEIMENATVVYIDGVKEQFDAIRIANKRIITGRISKIDGIEEFIESGFIPQRNIKQIYNGSKRKIQRMS